VTTRNACIAANQHAQIRATVTIGRIEGIADKTAITRLTRQMPGEIGDLPLKPPQRRTRQRHAQGHAGIRHRQPRGKIVAAIKHHIGPGQQIGGIADANPHPVRDDVQFRIKPRRPSRGNRDFGLAQIARRKQRLALQVRRLDHIVVDQRQPPDPRARQILQRRIADAAHADQHHVRLGQPRLPGTAQFGQDDVTGEAIKAVWSHGRGDRGDAADCEGVLCLRRASGGPGPVTEVNQI
jgi:hypothetical protein